MSRIRIPATRKIKKDQCAKRLEEIKRMVAEISKKLEIEDMGEICAERCEETKKLDTKNKEIGVLAAKEEKNIKNLDGELTPKKDERDPKDAIVKPPEGKSGLARVLWTRVSKVIAVEVVRPAIQELANLILEGVGLGNGDAAEEADNIEEEGEVDGGEQEEEQHTDEVRNANEEGQNANEEVAKKNQ